MTDGPNIENGKLRKILNVISKAACWIFRLDLAFIMLCVAIISMHLLLVVTLDVYAEKIRPSIEPIYYYFKDVDLLIHFKIIIISRAIQLLSGWIEKHLDSKVKKSTKSIEL